MKPFSGRFEEGRRGGELGATGGTEKKTVKTTTRTEGTTPLTHIIGCQVSNTETFKEFFYLLFQIKKYLNCTLFIDNRVCVAMTMFLGTIDGLNLSL